MRIAYIAHSFPPTGYAAAVNTYRIVRGLAERGHDLLVFCTKTASRHAATLESLDKGKSHPFDVVYSIPTPVALSVAVPHLCNALRAFRCNYDLVITQFHLWHLASFAGLFLKISKEKPWIVRVHDMVPDPALSTAVSERSFVNSLHGLSLKACYAVFLDYLGKKADKVFVLTRELQGLLLENGYTLGNVAVIPNGIDTKVFSPAASNGESVHKKTILYIGGMMPEDGLVSLIKAFSLLNPKENVNLTLIGDGPERMQLVELAKNLGLEQKVAFYNYVPHELISEIVNQAYIGVGPLAFTSVNNYTIPTKILEYFACGKPVVSAPVSADILTNGVNGFVVKKVSPISIAEKFSILLEDEKLAARMGKNARQLVVEKFDWEKVIDQIEREILNLGSHRFN